MRTQCDDQVVPRLIMMFYNSYYAKLWEEQQTAWVDTLSDQEVLEELEMIMKGQNYSWYSISRRLQGILDKGRLKLDDFEPGNIPYEWNVLCDEKLFWSLHNGPTFKSFRFNRTCLINLKTIPINAGLGSEGEKFVTVNIDQMYSLPRLTIEPLKGIESLQREEYRGNNGFFYAEGPMYRLEYIHDRVET